jgi:hypothetical protein
LILPSEPQQIWSIRVPCPGGSGAGADGCGAGALAFASGGFGALASGALTGAYAGMLEILLIE